MSVAPQIVRYTPYSPSMNVHLTVPRIDVESESRWEIDRSHHLPAGIAGSTPQTLTNASL